MAPEPAPRTRLGPARSADFAADRYRSSHQMMAPDFGTDVARGNARDVSRGARGANSCGQAAHHRRLPGEARGHAWESGPGMQRCRTPIPRRSSQDAAIVRIAFGSGREASQSTIRRAQMLGDCAAASTRRSNGMFQASAPHPSACCLAVPAKIPSVLFRSRSSRTRTSQSSPTRYVSRSANAEAHAANTRPPERPLDNEVESRVQVAPKGKRSAVGMPALHVGGSKVEPVGRRVKRPSEVRLVEVPGFRQASDELTTDRSFAA